MLTESMLASMVSRAEYFMDGIDAHHRVADRLLADPGEGRRGHAHERHHRDKCRHQPSQPFHPASPLPNKPVSSHEATTSESACQAAAIKFAAELWPSVAVRGFR